MLKLAGKIILLFFLTLLAIEGGLRLYNKINPSFIFPDNSYNRFRAKPNSRDYDFRLNSKGFKDQEFENNKQPGVFRILGIGDSFAFGVVPYKYNFLTLLENKLNQDSKHFEVINMGIPYISVDDYLGMLVNEGLELKPDMIVCCFFIGNDFVNIPKGANNLYLTSLLKFFFKIMPKYKGKIIHTDSDYFDDKPTFDFNTFLGIEKVGSWVFIKDSKVFTKQLQYVVSKLKKMQDICSRRGIEFLVILIPDAVQIDTALQSQVIARFTSLNKKNFDFEYPNRLLSARLRQFNIEYLDLLDDFMHASKVEELYKLNDTHWNISGNKLAADLIFNKLKNILKR